MQLLTTIPFCGFYESIHDSAIDTEIEQSFSDDTGCNLAPGFIIDGDHITYKGKSLGYIKYKPILEAYAKEYCSMLEFKLKEFYPFLSLAFESLQSPREYNFTTDRIFAHIPYSAVKKLYKAIDKEALRELIKDKFTSYDGFASFYSNNLAKWEEKPLLQWDHNEIGTLLECAISELVKNQDFEEDWELWLSQSMSENGQLGNIIAEGIPPRAWRVHSAVRERMEAIRTRSTAKTLPAVA